MIHRSRRHSASLSPVPSGRRGVLALAAGAVWAGAARGAWAAPPGRKVPMLDASPAEGEAEARKQRSIAILRAADVPVLDSLPLLPAAAEVRERSRDAVARRAGCLAVVAVMAEGDSVKAPLMGRLGLTPSDFSPKERAFLEDSAPSKRERAWFSWQYEGLAVLMWSQGVWTLDPPDTAVSVPAMMRAFLAAYERKETPLQPRPLAEVLDMADLVYRQRWAEVDAGVAGRPVPPGMDRDVLVERHRATGWLIGGEDWDDVRLDT